jgi:hypothetical protein
MNEFTDEWNFQNQTGFMSVAYKKKKAQLGQTKFQGFGPA